MSKNVEVSDQMKVFYVIIAALLPIILGTVAGSLAYEGKAGDTWGPLLMACVFTFAIGPVAIISKFVGITWFND